MRLQKLRVVNFRNLTDSQFETNAKNIFFIGNNGQGKTNLIEVIYFLSFGSSFRTSINRHIIREGETDASMHGIFVDDDGIPTQVGIRLSLKTGKEIFLDSKSVDDRKKLIEKMACIVFTHEDMMFVTGAPEKKRWFINQTMSLIDDRFIDLLRNYNKVLKLRNTVLRDKKYELLDLYDEPLASHGLLIVKKRHELFDEFRNTFSSIYFDITGSQIPVELSYKPSWTSKSSDEVINALKRNLERDKLFGSTTHGPHRDSFQYISGNTNFVHIGSTGQLRLLSLILRVAQLKFVCRKTGKKPIILLDDVMLELDREKRTSFLRHLDDYGQAFFTFLPSESYTEIDDKDLTRYLIRQGEVLPWREPAMY